MASYDGTKICELIGIFVLNKLCNIIDKNRIGFYRDDSLGVFGKSFELQKEQKKKKIIKIFKDCRLSITVPTNITSVAFPHLTLNLKAESYQPFRQPYNDLIYIDINSNHPPQTLKQLPKSISKRLSENLS